MPASSPSSAATISASRTTRLGWRSAIEPRPPRARGRRRTITARRSSVARRGRRSRTQRRGPGVEHARGDRVADRRGSVSKVRRRRACRQARLGTGAGQAPCRNSRSRRSRAGRRRRARPCRIDGDMAELPRGAAAAQHAAVLQDRRRRSRCRWSACTTFAWPRAAPMRGLGQQRHAAVVLDRHRAAEAVLDRGPPEARSTDRHSRPTAPPPRDIHLARHADADGRRPRVVRPRRSARCRRSSTSADRATLAARLRARIAPSAATSAARRCVPPMSMPIAVGQARRPMATIDGRCAMALRSPPGSRAGAAPRWSRAVRA